MTPSRHPGLGNALPVRRVSGASQRSASGWAYNIPAVKQILDDGLDLGPLTILVGENGSGKSTVVEAIAMAYGLSREGGSTGARHTTRESESDVWADLVLRRGVAASRWGFFLRAETMHGFYSYLEDRPGAPEPVFHEMSHGEGFLALLTSGRFDDPGFYLLDEPESALSFSGSLALVAQLHRISQDGRAQALVATHSPLVASVPGARTYEVGDWGLRETPWEELELVRNWRSFLDDPQRYLRHVI